MAITNAQQYQQLVNKPANGKRPGYRGDAAYGKTSGSAQAESFSKATSRDSAPSRNDYQGSTGPSLGDGKEKGYDKEPGYVQYNPTQALADAVKVANEKPEGILNKIPSSINIARNFINNIPFIKKQLEKNRIDFIKDQYPEYYDEEEGLVGLPANLQDLYDKGKLSSQQAQDVLMNMTSGDMNFPDYMATVKGSPALKYSGNVGNLEKYVTKRGPDGRPLEYGYREKMGGDGDGAMSDYERRLLELENQLKNQQNNNTDSNVSNSGLGGLAPRFAGSIFNFDGLADGGRAGMMDGGMMEDTPEGGIMDLESGRQMYFLGKLVKKATRAVKKVAKSPFGKAALLYGLGSLGAGALGKYQAGAGAGGNSIFSKAGRYLLGTKGVDEDGGTLGLLGKLGLTGGFGGFKPTLKGGLALGLGVPFALDALGIGKDKDDDKMDLDDYYRKNSIDIADIRNRPYNFLAPRFAADGGLMRTGYEEGGDAEPVAKETMPLIDMDGKEMDLREDGGFVPLGRMERADDVPARLSKNEFVFTADAVRNAGEGDIDKGAEVMYNMMKNLESGGEVSEESQGLDGAKEMFKTSQRLEEVL